MEYTRLGSTGLEVSRICLGCMSFGEPATGRPPLEHGRGRGHAHHPPGPRGGHQLLRHRQRLLGRQQRGDRRQGPRPATPSGTRSCWRPRSTAACTPAPTAPACPARPYFPRSTTACAGWASTTSTSTKSTVLTTAPRWKRRWKLSTTSCGRARPVMSAPRRCTPGSSPRCSMSPTVTAGPASFRCRTTTTSLYREEEREVLPLCADQGIGVIPWSPLARGRLTRDWDDSDGPQRDRRVRQAPVPRRATGPSSRPWPRWPKRAPSAAPRWPWPGCLSKPVVSAPIVGVTKPEQLADLARSAVRRAQPRRARPAGRALRTPRRSRSLRTANGARAGPQRRAGEVARPFSHGAAPAREPERGLFSPGARTGR